MCCVALHITDYGFVEAIKRIREGISSAQLQRIQLEMSLSNMLLLHEQVNIKIHFILTHLDVLLNEMRGLNVNGRPNYQ